MAGNHKIKVMHILSRLDVGGLENGVVNICNNLDRSRFEPSICCLKSLGIMAERLKDDVKVFNLSFSEGKNLFRPLAVANFFRKIRPDIVHTHAWGMGSYEGIIGARLANVPVVINGEHGAFFLKKYQTYLQRFLASLCNEVLSVSEGLKKQTTLELGIPPEKITVIYNGVNTKIFKKDNDTEEIKKELINRFKVDFNKNYFVVGSIGSLKPQKNQKLLLEALKEINKNNPLNNCVVIIIGDGPDRPMLEKYVVDYNMQKKVLFLGERNDVPKLLSLMDILVSTSVSRWEGLSNVILEAMSSGVPIIATKSTGTIELINDGINGFLFEINELNELAKKIELLAENKPFFKEISLNAREIAINKFSLEKMLLMYENFYMDKFNYGSS